MSELITIKNVDGESFKIDKQDLRYRPSVYGVVIKDSKILFVKYKNIYDLPGGGIERGERIKDALEREVFEETGLRVKQDKLVECTENFFRMSNGRNIHSIRIYYTVKDITGTPNLDNLDEYEVGFITGFKWVTLEEAKTLNFFNGFDMLSIIKKAYKIYNKSK